MHLKMKIFLAAPILLLLASCQTTRLPPIAHADRIEISSFNLPDGIEISDKEKIGKAIQFINSFPDGWSVPWYGPPVAAVNFALWNGKKLVGNFGVSSNFITRDYGDFWSQSVSSDKLRAFAESTHASILEATATIVPPQTNLSKELERAKRALNGLTIGSDIDSIYRYIQNTGFEITADYPNFINVTVKKLHEGFYADTVISGQYVLNRNRGLQNVRFFGLSTCKRIQRSKSIK